MDNHEHDPFPPTGSGRADRAPRTSAAYAARVSAARRSKDDLFRRAHGSPLAPEQRAGFAGLAYFPPDEAFRFSGLRLEPVAAGEDAPFTIATSDDRARAAHRLGRLRFMVDGHPVTLTAYRLGASSDEDSLFVPFRDRTSGVETYGAGRYLDIDPEPDGSYALDFNLAYNPLCAYSDAYSCPLPPPENWLPVRIEAGERAGDGGHGG